VTLLVNAAVASTRQPAIENRRRID